MSNLKKFNSAVLILFCVVLISCENKTEKDEWIDLFNGNDLTGWKASENTGSFKVTDGMIVANGKRSHLFYTGEVANANFRNFELKADVMTHHLTNSGIYFHTKYQEEGWPENGYEVQVNNTHIGGGDYREVKKTGSLYSIKNVYKAFAKDSTWFTMHIRVVGKHVTIKVNDLLTVDYVEPEKPFRNGPPGQKRISNGTFALQGHDPLSTVYFKNIKVKILDENATDTSKAVIEEPYAKIVELQTNHFPVIDMEVLASPSMNMENAMALFYRSGINLGIIMDASSIDPNKLAESLSNYITTFSHYPVFIGMKIRDKRPEGIDPKLLGQLDYVTGELNLDMGEKVSNKALYMDNYVKRIVDFLHRGEINNWTKPTQLPDALASEYDKLWTKERMLKVIEAAKEKGIAIEINEKAQLPSIEFIKLAKEKGCLFTSGNLDIADEKEGFDYYLKAINECKLEYKNIYVPKTIEPTALSKSTPQ